MPRLFLIALGLACWALAACAQEDSLQTPEPPPRVALIPFANLSGTAAALSAVMPRVRLELARRGVDLADSAAVSQSLREHRIRNTAELTRSEVDAVAGDLGARYLLLGTIDRYQQADSAAEVALSARLLDALTGDILWTGYADQFGRARTHLLNLRFTSRHVDRLAVQTAGELMEDFRLDRRARRPVQALHRPGRKRDVRSCRRIAVVILGNESATRFAGHVLANQLLHALHQSGFAVADPGRVREVMLDLKELSQGELSAALLRSLRMKLSVDIVLTGTVSTFDLHQTEALDAPAVAFEARLIDTAQGELLWAGSFDREGDDSARLFQLGAVHGLTDLSQRMARDLGRHLRHLRSRAAAVTEPLP